MVILGTCQSPKLLKEHKGKLREERIDGGSAQRGVERSIPQRRRERRANWKVEEAKTINLERHPYSFSSCCPLGPRLRAYCIALLSKVTLFLKGEQEATTLAPVSFVPFVQRQPFYSYEFPPRLDEYCATEEQNHFTFIEFDLYQRHYANHFYSRRMNPPPL